MRATPEAYWPPDSGGPWFCPLCHHELRPGRCARLNGVLVCRRCRNWFANRRQAAYLLDYLLLKAAGKVLGASTWFWVPFAPGASGWILPHGWASFLLAGALLLLFTLKDGFAGFSPGKWLWGVQVIDAATRRPIGFRQSFLRNLPLLVPLAELVLMNEMLTGRRAGDKLAGTMVILRRAAELAPFNPAGHFCAKCEYDLTGNVSGICPECGTPIPKGMTNVEVRMTKE